MKDLERVIVAIRDGELPEIWGFVNIGESDVEAEARAFFQSMDRMKLYQAHHKNYPMIMEDGSEYWENQYKAENEKEFKTMGFDEYKSIEREFILSLELKEISEEEYHEMLNILPPLDWITRNEVEVFCSSEFYTSSYTSQYARDKRSGKFYTKLVDYSDRSTWICELLRQ